MVKKTRIFVCSHIQMNSFLTRSSKFICSSISFREMIFDFGHENIVAEVILIRFETQIACIEDQSSISFLVCASFTFLRFLM